MPSAKSRRLRFRRAIRAILQTSIAGTMTLLLCSPSAAFAKKCKGDEFSRWMCRTKKHVVDPVLQPVLNNTVKPVAEEALVPIVEATVAPVLEGTSKLLTDTQRELGRTREDLAEGLHEAEKWVRDNPEIALAIAITAFGGYMVAAEGWALKVQVGEAVFTVVEGKVVGASLSAGGGYFLLDQAAQQADATDPSETTDATNQEGSSPPPTSDDTADAFGIAPQDDLSAVDKIDYVNRILERLDANPLSPGPLLPSDPLTEEEMDRAVAISTATTLLDSIDYVSTGDKLAGIDPNYESDDFARDARDMLDLGKTVYDAVTGRLRATPLDFLKELLKPQRMPDQTLLGLQHRNELRKRLTIHTGELIKRRPLSPLDHQEKKDGPLLRRQ
jgi:hypothetical protein